MKDSDYADLKICYLSLADAVDSATRQLREGADPAQVADFLEGSLVAEGAVGELVRDRALDAIHGFGIPEESEAADAFEKARRLDIATQEEVMAGVTDGAVFFIGDYDVGFDIDFHDKYDSLDYETAHLVVVRQTVDGTKFLRISPSQSGFEVSACTLIEDIFSVSARESVDTTRSLDEAIALAKAYEPGMGRAPL